MMEALPVIDARELPPEIRSLLKPEEPVPDHEGRLRILPRYFYRVANWDLARATKLTPHFTLAELMAVDCREARGLLQVFPHYVPCAVSILARYLTEFRQRVGSPVSIAVNGGYRSPSHAFSKGASPHMWGTAANIYRVGDTYLDSQRAIEKYSAIAREIGQEVFTKPYGSGRGETDDHLHFDLSFMDWIPRKTTESPPED